MRGYEKLELELEGGFEEIDSKEQTRNKQI